jgi:hypothetical protein
MNISTTVKALIIFAGSVSSSLTINTVVNDSFGLDGKLLTCIYMPYCGGPETFTPVSQPKDTKTETQDAKDEKLV